MTNWSQLLAHFLTLWIIVWGIRAGLVALVLGSLFWVYKRRYHGH